MRRRVTAALLAATLSTLLTVTDLPASAAADDPPPPTRTETLTVRPQGAPESSTRLAPFSADPEVAAQQRAAASGNSAGVDAVTAAETADSPQALATFAPPVLPDPADAAACIADGGGLFGAVRDRLHWCAVIEIVHTTLENEVPVGFSHIQLLTMAYGRDDGTRSVTIFARPLSVFMDGTDTPLTPVGLEFLCGGDPGCTWSAPVATTLGTLEGQILNPSWSRWTLSSDEAFATRTDKQSFHVFQLMVRYPASQDDTGEFGFRCDSATYIPNRPKACVFTDALTYLQYAIQDAAGNRTNQASVAEHIRQAQDQPDTTDPLPAAGVHKDIPGKYVGYRDERYLTRVANGSAPQRRNRNAKDAACARIPTPTNIPRPQCDEYPFQSTLQGAGSAQWDFSIKYVPGGENGSAGTALRTFYEQNRILYSSDRFWVNVVDKQGQGTGIPTGPRVDAGPDVRGDEGSAIALHGTADAGVRLHWEYRPVGPVDPGTTCTFSDPGRADAYLTCNDDGMFELTLEIVDDEGIVAADVTYARIRNAPPQVSIQGVTDWQAFRVGAPIVVHAPFTDGANDTHTCQWWWDDADGWEDSYAPRVPYDCGEVHGFEHAGMYTITVAVIDDDGATGSATVMLVVYDPGTGSANVDGSTATPAGAYVEAPATPGGTWVHYTGQYPPGGDTPYGQAKGWIDATGFRMEPLSMDWLVLTEDGKVASRGTSSVAGSTGYTWVLYGYDHCDGSNAGHCVDRSTDAVRLVVWETATGRVVYDHLPGVREYDVDRFDPVPMTSGAVQVHRFPR